MQSPRRANKTIFFLAIYLLYSQVLLLVMYLFTGFQYLNTMLRSGISQVVFFLIPFLFYLFVTRQNIKNVLAWKGLSIKNALLVFAVSVAIIPMLYIISFISSFVFVPVIDDFAYDIALASLWMGILFIGIFPSIFEEIWFRGVLFKEYRAGGISIHKVAIITGVFFGLIHMNFHQAIYAAAIGILYAYILYYTRSILAPMLAHFINNSLAVILANSALYMDWYASIQLHPLTFFVTMGIASAVMLPLVVYCMKQFKKHHASTLSDDEIVEVNSAGEPKSKLLTWGFWAALAVLLLLSALMEVVMRFDYVY